MELLNALPDISLRVHQISLCLKSAGALTAEALDELTREHNALSIRAGHIECKLYSEFGMTDKDVDSELDKLRQENNQKT